MDMSGAAKVAPKSPTASGSLTDVDSIEKTGDDSTKTTEEENGVVTTETETQTKLRRVTGIYDPCIFCEGSCCNLRTHCVVIAALEILIWLPLAVASLVLKYDYAYEVIVDPSADTGKNVVKIIFFVISGMSVLGGIIFIFAICARLKILCILHGVIAAIISMLCIIEMIITAVLVKKVPSKNEGRLITTAVGWFIAAGYYAIIFACSYGLYTQIKAGVDYLFPISMEQGVQFSPNVRVVRGTGPTTIYRTGAATIAPIPYVHGMGYPPMYGGYYGGYGRYGYGGDGLLTGVLLGSMLSPHYGYGMYPGFYGGYGGYYGGYGGFDGGGMDSGGGMDTGGGGLDSGGGMDSGGGGW